MNTVDKARAFELEDEAKRFYFERISDENVNLPIQVWMAAFADQHAAEAIADFIRRVEDAFEKPLMNQREMMYLLRTAAKVASVQQSDSGSAVEAANKVLNAAKGAPGLRIPQGK